MGWLTLAVAPNTVTTIYLSLVDHFRLTLPAPLLILLLLRLMR